MNEVTEKLVNNPEIILYVLAGVFLALIVVAVINMLKRIYDFFVCKFNAFKQSTHEFLAESPVSNLLKKKDRINITCSMIRDRFLSVRKLIVSEHSYQTDASMEHNEPVLRFWSSTKKMTVMLNGHITCGFDLCKMRLTGNGRNSFGIELPEPEIFSHEIDSRIIYSEDGWFNKVTPYDLKELEKQEKLKYETENRQSICEKAKEEMRQFAFEVMNRIPVSYTLRIGDELVDYADNRRMIPSENTREIRYIGFAPSARSHQRRDVLSQYGGDSQCLISRELY
ncbi:DUF4230 domain-containing protein [bacterium]|nr:DUF4230 domain-containing protein [bacterium]MBP5434423.1 DUF4230 domain-containing protein [bacterium]